MNKKIAFLTTIFPMKRDYLDDFFNSLLNQKYQDFDIIVVNDGYENLDVIKQKYANLKIVELQFKNTPAKNREYGINYCIYNKYDILIFGDSDDYFGTNRVEKSIELLQKYDIVVNDLSLFNSSGIYKKKYFSNRIMNNTEIDLSFIMDKNIFGLSNTAINLKLIEHVKFDSALIAVDWYFFSILLLKMKKAIFTNKMQTFYRQYSENTIGIGEVSTKNLAKIIKIKKEHYNLMKKHHYCYEELYKDIINLENEKQLISLLDLQIENPLWWEFKK